MNNFWKEIRRKKSFPELGRLFGKEWCWVHSLCILHEGLHSSWCSSFGRFLYQKSICFCLVFQSISVSWMFCLDKGRNSVLGDHMILDNSMEGICSCFPSGCFFIITQPNLQLWDLVVPLQILIRPGPV